MLNTHYTALFLLLVILSIVRLYHILPKAYRREDKHQKRRETCSLAVFLGSGGHTTEALALVSTLDFSRYMPRLYIVSEGDQLSAQKAQDLELHKKGLLEDVRVNHDNVDYVLVIPRARRVHQSLPATLPTALRSLFACCYHLFKYPILEGKAFSDVLILNGPGTCFTICLACYIGKFIGLKTPRLIYVETFARVHSLSLSGKLLRYFADRFVVQWPNLLVKNGRGECHGWLV